MNAYETIHTNILNMKIVNLTHERWLEMKQIRSLLYYKNTTGEKHFIFEALRQQRRGWCMLAHIKLKTEAKGGPIAAQGSRTRDA